MTGKFAIAWLCQCETLGVLGLPPRLSSPATHRYGSGMPQVVSINPHLVEALYVEALVLSDAARSGFDDLRAVSGQGARSMAAVSTGFARDHMTCPDTVEVTCEALRTSTRVMHCLAWLLNQRAWFAGQLSAVQLRRHGRLVNHFPVSDARVVARLPEELAEVVRQSERLYVRIQRLDTAWRSERMAGPGAIERLRERLAPTGLRQA